MFIKVNGVFPQDPQLLLQEYSRMGWDTSVWKNKANAFHYNRGTSPSIGWFLLMFNEIPESNLSIEINTTYTPPGEKKSTSSGNSITIQGLQVAEAEVINPIENPEKGIYLVKIIDPIVNRWSHTYVNQDFNVPIGIIETENPPGSSNIDITTRYDKSTINGNDPYTWQELFDIVSGNTIDVSQARFPQDSQSLQIPPEGFKFKNNADGRPMTIKQALDALLLVTGHTIIRKPDQTLELIPIDASDVEETLSNFRSQFLRFDSHKRTERESIKLPGQLKFRFPKIAIGSTLDNKYTTKTLTVQPTSGLPFVPNITWLVNAPLYDNGDNSSEIDQVSNHFGTIYIAAFKGLSPELQELELSTYVDLIPDKGISKVIWFYTGDGAVPRTYISSFPGIEFPQSPEVVPHEILAKGTVTGLDITTGIFDVTSVELMSGGLDYITGGGDIIQKVSKVFPNQTIEDGNKVVVFYSQSNGRYEAFTPGGGGVPGAVKQFGLLEDMALADTQKFATSILGNLSLDFQTQEQEDNDGSRKFYVLDFYFKHVGKARVTDTDDFTSDDREYRGFSQFIVDNWQGTGFPAYEILYMDHPARILTVRLLENQGGLSGALAASSNFTRCEILQSVVTPSIVQQFGYPEQGRLPNSNEGGTVVGTGGDPDFDFDLRVYDEQLETASRSFAKKDEHWYAIFVDDLDHYEFFKPVREPYIFVRGKVKIEAGEGDTDFEVHEIEIIAGANPLSLELLTGGATHILTPINDPKKARNVDDKVELQFDRTISDELEKQWRPIESTDGPIIFEAGIAVVFEDVQGKTEIGNVVKLGKGKVRRLRESETVMGDFEIELNPLSDFGPIHENADDELKFQMFNMTPVVVRVGKIIQWKKFGRLWPQLGDEPIAVIDAEDCG